MNREHVVGCPALRAGVRCTCQIVPSSRVKPPTRVEEIRRKFPNMVGTWGAEAITFLLAENERLRAEVTFFDGQHAAAMETVGELSDRVEHAEARTRALEAALRGMLICDDRCKRPQCVQARAALTEPTPPVCSNPAHWDEPHPCPMCRATPPAGGQG